MRTCPKGFAFFATLTNRAVAVRLNAFWNGTELAYAISDCCAELVVADGERLDRLAAPVDDLKHIALVGTRLDERKTDADAVRQGAIRPAAGRCTTGRPGSRCRTGRTRDHLLHVLHKVQTEGRPWNTPQHVQQPDQSCTQVSRPVCAAQRPAP
jgi:long-subunit acyl-CoA synthetase (AMP-forming)